MFIELRHRIVEVVWRQVYKWLSQAEQVVLVFGPPGTGKTYTGGKLVFEGHAEGVELRVNSVYPVAVYFNRSMADSAAKRFKKAIKERYGGKKYAKHAVKTVDGLAVSLAKRQGYKLYVGWGLDRCFKLKERPGPELAIELLRACFARDAKLDYNLDPYGNPGRGNEVFHAFDYYVNAIPVPGKDGVDLLISALVESSVLMPNEAAMLRSYVEFLLSHNSVDYTLAKWLAFYTGAKYTVKHHKLGEIDADTVFIDEAQDLSPLMWLILTKAFPNPYNVVIAGDDDQTVYRSLHGAEPGILLKIARALDSGELRGPKPVVLRQSHRVAKEVAEVAKSLIAKLPNRWPKEWQGRDVVASVKKIGVKEAIERIVAIYEQETRQLRESQIPEAFVLTPTNRAVLDWYHALMAAGILPSSLKQKLPLTVERIVRHYLETGEAASDTLERMVETLKNKGYDPKARLEKMFVMAKSGESPVVVDTAYTAKGLEARVVFVINTNTAADLEERIRLGYVALTRARENVYVVDMPTAQFSPLWIPL